MIRPMRQSDITEMHGIALRSLDENYLPEIFYEFYAMWSSGQIVSCDFLGKPIGFICCTKLMDGGCRIMLFAVDAQWRGRGKGSELLDAVKRVAVMERIRYITLEVRAENIKAQAFYRRHGFIELDRMRSYYNDGGDAVRMYLFLS